MKKSGEEEKVKQILTDEKLSAIKTMLEKDHAIDCLLLLHVGRGKWKDAKDFMRENNLTLSDGTFRARMIEIEQLGLAKSERMDETGGATSRGSPLRRRRLGQTTDLVSCPDAAVVDVIPRPDVSLAGEQVRLCFATHVALLRTPCA